MSYLLFEWIKETLGIETAKNYVDNIPQDITEEEEEEYHFDMAIHGIIDDGYMTPTNIRKKLDDIRQTRKNFMSR